MKAGDSVTVNLGRRGGVQQGTVVRVLADGRFVWRNRCNIERTSKTSQVTAEPEREGVLDPYMKEWLAEPGDE